MKSYKSIHLVFIIFIMISCYSCKNDKTKMEKEPQSEKQETVVEPKIDSVGIAIINGNILDGTGKKAYQSNIYIKGDSIVYIGNLINPKLKIGKTIDAKGSFVSPGFIDLHAHGNPLNTPDFENFLAMGVTTIVLGQDGSSANVKDLKSYLDQVNTQNLGVNIVEFVGHGTLRNLAGIGVKSKITETELEKLKTILKERLKHTFGLSTGLEYAPGLYAEESELVALSEVVGKEGKLIMSHMRNEDDEAVIESIKELSRQGKYAKVHISHLKSVYGKGATRAIEILDTIKEIRKSGIQLTADMYPYMASYTGIGIVFPDWSKTPQQFAIAKKTRRKELEDFIKNKVNLRNGPEATLLGSSPYTGMTLAEAAASKNKPFEKFLIEDLGPQGSSGAYFVMNKELQETFLKDPIVGICSDGSKTGHHPRGHGTFAKIIETYVVKDSLLSLEEAVRKMTSYAAEILQLKNRGTLTIGNKADIIIFDPKNIKAPADYVNPHQLATGFEKVLVNGKLVRDNEQLASSLNGKVLLPK
ncbi:amidohydrolase family protein [Aureibaculum sp. 2210JD6-5]|uniref:N-acyl-D-amino-acid deacylase family protein n=1 Tax=Aureibaculum sp. 2210JD6-5 TaxID=3103957 RepID=UPI002AAD9303|nr:amidohydrolase family protein [Aureibaculum sp. 2210JD6-5]MDY7396126.1 amidohydrolase family protein [Aureibaculum sp. 2210JD6-5]